MLKSQQRKKNFVIFSFVKGEFSPLLKGRLRGVSAFYKITPPSLPLGRGGILGSSMLRVTCSMLRVP